MSRSNICRVCGSSKLEQDLIGDLNLKEGEPATSFRDLISYYSHVQLNSSTSLPTKVCKFCHSFIHSFISFCDNLNKVEMNFAIASEKVFNCYIWRGYKNAKSSTIELQMIKEKQVSVKQETSTSLPGDSKVEPAGSQSRGSRVSKTPGWFSKKKH